MESCARARAGARVMARVAAMDAKGFMAVTPVVKSFSIDSEP
jgi:hypothetical protein